MFDIRFLVAIFMLLASASVRGQTGVTRQVNSDPQVMLAYTSLGAFAMLGSLEGCDSESCRLLRNIDRAMESESLIGVATAFAFSQRTWVFDAASVGSYYGDLRNSEGQVFISTPIAAWNGDLAIIVSAVSPQRVSILRVANARLGGIPSVSLVFDSVSKGEIFGKDRTPIGTVDRLEVVMAEKIVVIGNPIGQRDLASKRPHLFTFTARGIEISRE